MGQTYSRFARCLDSEPRPFLQIALGVMAAHSGTSRSKKYRNITSVHWNGRPSANLSSSLTSTAIGMDKKKCAAISNARYVGELTRLLNIWRNMNTI